MSNSLSDNNILQEYCQKNKLKLTMYKCKSCGPPHNLKWFSKVRVAELDIELDTTAPANSKISAEQQAASMVLSQLKNLTIDDVPMTDHINTNEFKFDSVY